MGSVSDILSGHDYLGGFKAHNVLSPAPGCARPCSSVEKLRAEVAALPSMRRGPGRAAPRPPPHSPYFVPSFHFWSEAAPCDVAGGVHRTLPRGTSRTRRCRGGRSRLRRSSSTASSTTSSSSTSRRRRRRRVIATTTLRAEGTARPPPRSSTTRWWPPRWSARAAGAASRSSGGGGAGGVHRVAGGYTGTGGAVGEWIHRARYRRGGTASNTTSVVVVAAAAAAAMGSGATITTKTTIRSTTTETGTGRTASCPTCITGGGCTTRDATFISALVVIRVSHHSEIGYVISGAGLRWHTKAIEARVQNVFHRISAPSVDLKSVFLGRR